MYFKVNWDSRKQALSSILPFNFCSCCNNNYCLHYQAFVQCSQIVSLKVCEANAIEDMVYYLISPTNISLVVLDTLHNYTLKNLGGWSCNSCIGKCKEQIKLHNILSMIEQPSMKSQRQIDYTVVSSNPIPFILDEALTSTYDKQLYEGINLPKMLIPEQKYCKNGYKFNEQGQLKLENIGIVIYTENDVIRLNEHTVYSSICDGSCKCQAFYEGQTMLLLNINNKYFIHYSLLYDYSELMTMSKNTLYGYLSAKNQKFQRMGRKSTFKYHIVYHAWNAYLRLVDLDYSSHYTCTQCKLEPKIVVIDGIAMGTMRSLPKVDETVDYEQTYSLINTSDRIFIHDANFRKSLLNYSLQGLTEDRFHDLMDTLNNKEFCDYLLFSSSNLDHRVTVSEGYERVRKIIQLLCRTDPITGLFQFSLLNSNERKSLIHLSKGGSAKKEPLNAIYKKMQTLECLINSIQPSLDIDGNITLHPIVASLLRRIFTQIDCLSRKPSRKLVEFCPKSDEYYNYFPSFTKHYKIPIYQDEKLEVADNCSKRFPKHHKFSPGLIAITCQHRVCYGFQILRQHESTVLVYNLLLSIFNVQPKVIIYDNACNLHKTCMKRDPKLFLNTTFLIDRFHSTNHKCNPSYSLRNIHTEEMKKINSQVCEQLFSSLRRIAIRSHICVLKMYFSRQDIS